MRAPSIHYAVAADGVRIAYYAMGRGTALVSTSEVQWSHLGNTLGFREHHRSSSGKGLGRGMRGVRYDARGTGLSDHDAIDFSLETQARDIESGLAAAGVDRFALYGHTHGSPLAIWYAAHHPERVTHLILCLPHARGRDLPPIAHNLGVRVLDDMDASQWEQFTLTMASAMLAFSRPDLSLPVAKNYREAMTPRSYVAFLRWRMEVDVSALLPRIRVPTLVLSRRASSRPPTEVAVAAAIPGCQLVTNEAARVTGLWLDEETHAVEEFLRTVPASDANAIACPSSATAPLTRREREVLALLVAGQSNREIATTLVLSERTVARHIANIYEKTGAHGRAEATAYAFRQRLV